MSSPDNDDDPPAEYTNVHRALLQALLSRGTLTLDSGKPLLAAILTAAHPLRPTLPEDITPEDLHDHLSTLHAHLSPLDFEIRSAVHQRRRERVWALVNTTSDALTRLATVRGPDEMAFVRRVLDAMFDTYNSRRAEVLAVTGMQALKLARGPPRGGGGEAQQTQSVAGLTMHQGERVLSSLVAEGWFELSDAGFYSLSPRGLLELRTWLEDMYNEPPDDDDEQEEGAEAPHVKIKSCAACRDLVTIGQRCPNLVCNTRLHDHCVRNAFRGRGNGEKCPSCQTDWVDPPPVGENAAQRGGGEGAARNSRGGGRSSARTQVEEDDDEDDDEE